jgi:hypothetical protein
MRSVHGRDWDWALALRTYIFSGHLAKLVTWLILQVARRGNSEFMLFWVLYFEARCLLPLW